MGRIERNLANLQTSQAHLNGIVVGEADDRVNLTRCDSSLLRVADRRNRHVRLGQASLLHGRARRVVIRTVLAGDTDRLPLQVSQRRNLRARRDDDRPRVGGVVLTDRDDVQALCGGRDSLVTRGNHHILLAGQERREEALVRTVVADRRVDTRLVIHALCVGHVHGRELNIRNVGQADRDVRGVLGTRLSGRPTGGARRQGKRGARAEGNEAKSVRRVQGVLLHCVMS